MQYRFFVDGPVAGVALDQVQRDARAASLSPAMRLYYRWFRPLIPLHLRHMLQSARRERGTGKWYLPDAFQHSLVQSLVNSTCDLTVTHPWPHGARFAFVLTHDVEDQRGFRGMCRVADVEQELGFRSSFNLVPYKYPIDTGLVRELQSRGFEIGIHGYNHDGRLYLSERIFRSRLSGIHAALRKYEAVGFRSPMVHRNLEWLQMLDIEYDASCFDVDPYQAMPGGVGSLWPFMAGRFVELPYTLPQDHTLFIVLDQQDTRIWEEKLHYVARRHGMALMLTHPDYLDSPDRLRLYRDFLAMVNERSGHWHALPRDVARWWRIREQSPPQQLADGRWTVTGPAADQAVPAMICIQDGAVEFRVGCGEM